ncbi:MAG: helix-turn-helix transcriptional regulator [Geitlerinemataceae cyanobacterium]
MATSLGLPRWSDVLRAGTANDTRLFHSGSSDRIEIVQPQCGRGYFQRIPLRDDLTLMILDYTLDRDLTLGNGDTRNTLELTFHLASSVPNRTLFCPGFGVPHFFIIPAGQRFFKVELFFNRPNLKAHYRDFLDRLAPQTQAILAEIVQSVHRCLGCRRNSQNTPALAQALDDLHDIREFDRIYYMGDRSAVETIQRDAIVMEHAVSCPISQEMQPVLNNILSCPYQGRTRRTYLNRQADRLVELRLAAMEQQPQGAIVDEVYEAGAILRREFVNPPSVEALARRVHSNRFKLTQGFHLVYDTTPFGYIRDCRMIRARDLLITSELSVVQVAKAVGYTCRSKFATAFRKKYGINPKAFQMRAWAQVS